MAEIVMPVLGPEMDEGRILRWLNSTGEIVNEGEALLEVEGDKTTVQITAPASGTLSILSNEGAVVPVRWVIGRIGEEGGAHVEPPQSPVVPSATSPAGDGHGAEEDTALTLLLPRGGVRASPRAKRLAAERGVDLSTVVGTGPNGMISEQDVHAAAGISTVPAAPQDRLKVSPQARKLADQLGIDLAVVTPTGVGGRIMEEDVHGAAGAAVSPPAVAPAVSIAPLPPAIPAGSDPGELLALTPARRVTAERMAASWHSAPRVTLHLQVDMRKAVRFRKELNLDWAPDRVKISVDALLVRAAALALTAHPEMNTRWDEGAGVRRFNTISIAVAVDTDRGLLVPVLKNVGAVQLDDIARRLAILVDQARKGTLMPEELSGGTFTVTNLGARGVDAFSPMINPPQAGILAAGRIAKRPWVDGDALCVAETMTLSLAFDHRAIDGGPAADVLAAIGDNLEHPFRLLRQIPR